VLVGAAAVEVILAAPKKVPKEEKLFVEQPGFGKVRQQQQLNKEAYLHCSMQCIILIGVPTPCWVEPVK
jgi:hypothetical protein